MWTRSNQTGRPLNMFLKLVTLCSHGSEDPNQHQKAAMFVSTWRLSLLSLYPLNILIFLCKHKHSFPDAILGRDVFLFGFFLALIYLFIYFS